MSNSLTRVIPLLVASLALVACSRNTGTVTLVNTANEPLARATLTMSWGETLEVTDVDPAETTTMNYRVREGEYRVEVVFASGKRLETPSGFYVTSGVDFQDQITVTTSEIRVIHTPVSSEYTQP